MSMTRQIALNHGLVAIVDAEDYERLSQYRWSALKCTPEHIYARARMGDKTVPMHRMVMDAPPNTHVDHINRNGLDNRKENLRVCLAWQNASHSMRRRVPTHGYRGIMRAGEWFYATISHCGWKVLGDRRATEIEAAHDYDLIVTKLKGEFAVLNFPHEARP